MIQVHTITLNPAIDQTVRLDALVPGAVHRAAGQQSEAGGKGIGVASVLAALGVHVSASGWLGADNVSLFETAFAQRGIHDSMLRVPGLTRTNIKLAVANRGDTTDINLPGIAFSPEALAQAEAELLALLDHQVRPGDWCELAGSLPPGAGVGTWVRLAQQLVSLGANLMVDTGGSVLRDMLQQLPAGAMPAFIKPNRAELEELVDQRLDTLVEVADAASALRAQGIRHVVVSLGGEGAVIVSAEGRWHASTPRVPVATTVGAGDALVAGTLGGLIEGRTFPAAAVFGMACAAARIQRIAPELPPREEIERLARKIDLKPL